MAYYVCIAIGATAFLAAPDNQIYISAGSGAELLEAIAVHTSEFDDVWCEGGEGEQSGPPHRHAFRMPSEGENNWSQRLRIARDADMVLDVIGMTEEEYGRESAD